ncbi:hypothetical protein BUALT_Bualt19G0122500 [Buddleja alternifolia]|uniref:Uncharacterized protein n=1 Tax=Buddleja alternifolia TaxID=168488 RepID=A0AAV6W761_9LAMI|nr:hypothetical protein BUALT_Bualt19G0122500 [Buddleja alternifolia]
MAMGAPLEDACHLAQRYDWMRQEAEIQAVEVARKQAKVREGTSHPDMALKLEASEAKLHDLKSNVATLGREAMLIWIFSVEVERTYHQRALQILDQLEGEIMSERQRIEAAPSPSMDSMSTPPSYEDLLHQCRTEQLIVWGIFLER